MKTASEKTASDISTSDSGRLCDKTKPSVFPCSCVGPGMDWTRLKESGLKTLSPKVCLDSRHGY